MRCLKARLEPLQPLQLYLTASLTTRVPCRSPPKRGLIRPKNTKCVYAFFLVFLKCLEGCFGVLILPKWLINDSGHVAILFESFLELPNM